MNVAKFVKTNTAVVAIDDISSIDCNRIDELIVIVTTKGGLSFEATELNALELVMQTRPAIVEGKRLRASKYAWMVHNLVGHPVMQVLALCKFYKAAFWVHDVTVPRNQTKRSKEPHVKSASNS